MKGPSRNWWIAIALTVALLLLITFSLTAPSTLFLIFMLVIIVAGVSLLYWLFPGSHLFSIAFANYLAIYAYIFIFFIEENFRNADVWAVYVGFAAPILAFLGGVWRNRLVIAAALTASDSSKAVPDSRSFLWLLPVLAIGVLTFALPWRDPGPGVTDGLLLLAMGSIALIVLLVSADVCRFVLETGLLFEDFFGRIRTLVAPAFVFFTFYSLLVMIFAAIFRLVDRLAPGAQFLIEDVARDITLQESLYFSLITLSTVGYGDIVPLSILVRIIAGIEIICGVLLLLFGFSEIITYAREHRPRRGGKP